MATESLQLKYPIVLIHGLGARSTYGPFDYFYGLPSLLKRAKNQIYVANLTPWQSIENRARQLRDQIDRVFPEGKLNLVGHSMGGLDARYLTSQLGFSDRVSSITTIGTPNRGTSAGDLANGLLPDSAYSMADQLLKFTHGTSSALKQITRQHCLGELAELTPNMPQVAYFSATTAIREPLLRNALPIFWLSHGFLKSLEGDNDGFVSIESAKWGHHICTESGDHYAQIGQFLGRSRGLNYIRFYHEIFGHLKKEGF